MFTQDPNDIYQQFEIVPDIIACGSGGTFSSKSVTPDGFPPHFLIRRGWEIYTKTPKTYELGEALGVNTTLRAHLPDFNCHLLVGKWYCPFMFVRDGSLRDPTEDQREVVLVGRRKAVWDENRVGHGVVYFFAGVEEVNIGLSSLIVYRMKWE
ncbi:uncharacterized protein LOC131309414 [Rhododendron vialii]|uniref:uncharacterized protein LOC131309414 n=1 Tax=Rhododendron vialii TaxID=182163 RepID=UPI00265F3AEE|nr:uncharacterized protein LOC131309414 [Rhododendron vialii]